MNARAPKFDIDAFKAWLMKCGAIIDPPTNPWEIIRVRTYHGTLVAYRNAKGGEKWPPELLDYRDRMATSQEIALSPDLTSRFRLRQKIEELAARDGLWCWFCEIGFLGVESREISIEHLVPKSHGGPDHSSNLVLACHPCNGAVGRLSVSEKVTYREAKRGYFCTPVEQRA